MKGPTHPSPVDQATDDVRAILASFDPEDRDQCRALHAALAALLRAPRNMHWGAVMCSQGWVEGWIPD